MRLPLQIAVGQAFVVLFPVGLTLLAISVLVEVSRNVDAISVEDRSTIQAAEEVHRALLRYEMAQRENAVDRMEDERNLFSSAMQTLQASVKGTVGSETLSKIGTVAKGFFEGKRSAADLMDAMGDISDLQDDLVARGGDRILKVSQSGTGLVAVLGALGLLTALFFGYWLTRTVGYPLERAVRAVEAIAAGDVHRRVGSMGSNIVIDRLSAGVNQLADRLQRVETDRRLDYLLVRAGVEKLLEERRTPGGILTPGRRLLVANRGARLLLDEQGANLETLMDAVEKEDPASVERVPLTGPDGTALGELVFVKRPQAPAAAGDGTR